MKKNYITPEINVKQLEALCSGVFATASVYEELPREIVSARSRCSTRRRPRTKNCGENRTAISGAMTDTIVCYRNR